MHLIRRHTVPSLLLLLASVAVANAFVPKRRPMRYLIEASARPSIDSNQSLHRRDVSFPFSLLQLRGGSVGDEIAAQIENGEETIDETTEDSETPKAERVWEEEIKRTQSFYQEQSVNASESIDDGGNGVEDLRGYGSSQLLTAQGNPKVVITEGDESDPAQANEDKVDAAEVKDDAEDNDTIEVDTENELHEEILEQVAEEEEEEGVTESEPSGEVLEEQEVVEEALQVEVVAEEQSSDNGGVENVDVEAEEVSTLEDDEGNDAVEVSDEVAKEEVIEEEEEVLEGEIVAQEEVLEGEIVAQEQSTAVEEDAGNEGVVDSSVTQLVDAEEDDDVVVEGDADAADESSESTPEHDPHSSIATLENDEPSSLVRKVSDLLQVMLLRGRIAVSKNKGIQYLAQNKSKMKVIALASLGGLLIFLRAEGQAMQEAETTLELPNDDWLEDESYVDETDGDE